MLQQSFVGFEGAVEGFLTVIPLLATSLGSEQCLGNLLPFLVPDLQIYSSAGCRIATEVNALFTLFLLWICPFTPAVEEKAHPCTVNRMERG